MGGVKRNGLPEGEVIIEEGAGQHEDTETWVNWAT